MRLELSANNWAELRDPEKMTNKQRRPLMRATAALGGTANEDGSVSVDLSDVKAEDILDIGDATIVAFVEAWSYGPPPSEKPETLDDLPAHDYDRLQHACGELLPRIVWQPQTVKAGPVPLQPSTTLRKT